MAPFWINKMILYFYSINTAREQLVITKVNFLPFVRLADVSISCNALIHPRAREGGGTEVTLVPMDIMAVANAIWRV